MKRNVMTVVLVVACAAGIAWFVRGINESAWKSDQAMHIRWNLTWLHDQYERIDRLGNEDLRRDYVTNFYKNACILLNLDCARLPNTSNLVERYYFDWDERISDAEKASKRMPE